jgi:hypothetical protein
LIARRAVLKTGQGLHAALIAKAGGHLIWALIVQAIGEGRGSGALTTVFRAIVRVLAQILLAHAVTTLTVRTRWGGIEAA